MNYYAIYNTVTGEYRQHCSAGELSEVLAICTDQQSAHPLISGTSISDCYFDGAGPCPKGISPSIHHTFNWATKQWQDLRTLQDLRAAKWAEIKQARSVVEYGGFTWDTSTFDSDAISQARIQGAVQLAGMSADFAIDWTLADNAARTLSAANMLAVGAALGLHVASQFAKARGLRAQVEAAASAAELTLIGW